MGMGNGRYKRERDGKRGGVKGEKGEEEVRGSQMKGSKHPNTI